MWSSVGLIECSYPCIFNKENVGIDVFPHFCRDMYEGTRMAREEDLSGIRKIIRPLEESGVLVRRTDKEVITLSSSEQNIDEFRSCVCLFLSSHLCNLTENSFVSLAS